MLSERSKVKHHLQELEAHLKSENPLLVEAIKGFRQLDKVGHRLGLLRPEQSYAAQIPWWPLISVLGTYSAGKSTFINTYIDYALQDTGNQAGDDKFTVISYSSNSESRTLPGVALNADPRFPFYHMAEELDAVSAESMDAYLQLKTCPSDKLRGYIFIDSPGFDDTEREAAAQITDHIIGLSDLVLLFFDVRHPSTEAMSNALDDLFVMPVSRKDADKFVYILNQTDTLAPEGDVEEIVAGWQKALSQQGLAAEQFLTIYDQQVAVPIDDHERREQLETQRQQGLNNITQRIQQVHTDRIYRVLGNLEQMTRHIEQQTIPRLRQLVRDWERGVLWRDVMVLGVMTAGLFAMAVVGGAFKAKEQYAPWLQFIIEKLQTDIWYPISAGGVLFVVLFLLHQAMRALSLRAVMRSIDNDTDIDDKAVLKQALIKNTRFLRSIFRPDVVGWGRSTRRRLHAILEKADQAIQKLNDQYTRPSGQVES